MFMELFRLKVKSIKIAGQRCNYNNTAEMFWPPTLQNLDITGTDKPMASLIT
jgi:hypothetical protein